MRVVIWFALIALSVTSVLTGHLVIALCIAAAKAVLVGLEFMELRHAARLRAAAWVLFVAVILAVLTFITAR